MKTCSKCGIKRDLSEFSNDSRRGDGKQSHCKSCRAKTQLAYTRTDEGRRVLLSYRHSHKKEKREHQKLYQQTEVGKEAYRKNSRRQRLRFPKRTNAVRVLNHAVQDGKFGRSVFCEECGLPTKTEGHHEDYSKPLNVNWLCRKCHTETHKEKQCQLSDEITLS